MISQGYVSKSLGFPWLNRYRLRKYNNKREPCVFFGCYQSGVDVKRILQHEGFALVVWGGTDALSTPKASYEKLKAPNIKHIAISNYLVNTLTKNGLMPYHFPIVATKPIADPVKLGKCVYTYIDPRRPDFYGMPIIKELKRRVKFPFIIGYRKGNTKEWAYKAYRSSFIGLRLTKHDGLSNTVVEMGLFGRRCVWNGNIPSSIGWTDINEIVEHINREREITNPRKVAYDTAKYIDIGDEWLKLSTYK